MKIALLGWGSLIWDERPEFDSWVDEWQPDGPSLNVEFSRISGTRSDALTLVVDHDNGANCTVQYAMSKRRDPHVAINDLKKREGTILKRIGCHFADGSHIGEPDIPENIRTWTADNRLDVVIWTGLSSNFHDEKKTPFSIPSAISHLQSLTPEGKVKAAEYVRRAPDLIDTPLRRALVNEKWFVDIAAN